MCTEGVKGAIGKPPCRLRRGDSHCNILQKSKRKQELSKNGLCPRKHPQIWRFYFTMSGITMRDIGRQLGVSAVTVSKALAGKSGVSEEMRQKIIRRASELGYVNPNAPQTTTTSGLDVGILIPENFFSVVSFYATFYKQLVQALTDAGHFGIMELVTHDMQTALTLPNLLRSRHVDALICLGQLTSPYMQLLTRQEMPVICLDFHDPFVTTDAIVSDNAFGAAQLTYWLIEQGHRDIGFVGDIKATSSIMERYLGFLSAMLMKDLPVRPECVFSDRSPEGNMFHTFQLPEKMPTAFVVNCDMSAQALMTDLQSRGYRVPEDISVVGFDDFCPTAGNTPPLTTFRVNCPAMCRMAVKLIGERCAGDRKAVGRVVIGGECVFRDSAAPVSVIH